MSINLSDINDLINLRRYLFDASNGFFAGIRKDQIREVNELVKKLDIMIVSNASNAVEHVLSESMVKKVVKQPVPIKSVSNTGLPTHLVNTFTVNTTEDEYAKSLAIIDAARKAGLLNPPGAIAKHGQIHTHAPVSPAAPGVPGNVHSQNGVFVVQGETFASDLNQPHNFEQSEDVDSGEEGEDPDLQLDNEHAVPAHLLAAMEAAKQAKLEAEAEAPPAAAEPSGIVVSKKARGGVVKRLHETR